MKSLTALNGKYSGEIFSIENKGLFSGLVRGIGIPYSEIVKIEKNEVIKGKFFVEIYLSDGTNFTSSMNESSYKDLYEKFNKLGNTPEYITLDKKKTFSPNAFYIILGIVVLFLLSSNDTDKNNTLKITEKSKVELCKAYIGTLFGVNTSSINHYRSSDGIFYVKYIRNMDKSEWRYACDITGNVMVWTGWLTDKNDWGRWRFEDEVTINASEDGKNLFFIMKDTGRKVEVKI